MYIRTLEERTAAIERLKQNKKKCNKYNFFGDDNHEHLDIAIDVIENERTEDYIYTTYPSCNKLGEEDSREHSKWVAAIGARDYLMGKHELEDILYPENKG